MDGVKVKFLNKEEILSRLIDLAKNLMALKNNVIEVSIFGSLARGNYSARSDADILILLREDPRKFIDRIPEFLSYFSNVGIPIDVFPYTQEELNKMTDRNFIKAAQKEKVILDSRI
ncbi:MAG: nucleotidyltransferase domain-containing protein [Thermodesulfobacteriota bacterium]